MMNILEALDLSNRMRVERAYRRGFDHGMNAALLVATDANRSPRRIARWIKAVQAWRNVPFEEMLPITPPPEIEASSSTPTPENR